MELQESIAARLHDVVDEGVTQLFNGGLREQWGELCQACTKKKGKELLKVDKRHAAEDGCATPESGCAQTLNRGT